MKLKASALYYALIFSVLIAVLSVLLILFSFYSRTELSTYLIEQKLIRNCSSGLELLKSENFTYQNTKLDLFKNNKDSVLLKKNHWGLFDIYSSTAFSGNKKINKTALIACQNSKYENTALYMNGFAKTLSISGKTKIVGNAYLSKSGIKRTNIEGNNYIGNKLIYGNKLLSEKTLPKLNNKKQQYLKEVLEFKFKTEIETVDISELYSKTNINNDFSKKTTVFKSNNSLNLNNINLKNNIIIYSNKEIIVHKSTTLNNIILVAPSIIIKKNTKGSFHIIAKDSIVIEENVDLKYPSSIAISSNKSAFIQIQNNAKITGDIALNAKNSNRKKSFIDIKKDVILEGNLYCNGIVSLKGTVYGSLFCNKFYLKTSSAIYENYLLNAIIDNSKRDKNYTSGFIFEEKVNKKIAAWY